jgi:two-component system, cell cycle sensor histidine kinase and response regulator CckA
MKPEVVFGLENAAWPCLLVNPAGAVMIANTTAKNVFGASLATLPAQLSVIWAPENGNGATEFLSLWQQSPTAVSNLKFKTADGATATFSTAISAFQNNSERCIVLQLISGISGAESVPSPKTATEGDAALKQKLDCVLQLARTVSLDFNNALTGVLAHTSLLLGKAEAEHPWRRSLLEVEKSAARAAEIASELALFSRQEKEARRAPAGNLNTVISRCVDVLKNTHGTRITWNISLERAIFEARFEEAKVQQSLQKILENAVESFPLSQMSRQISVQTRSVELTEATQDRNVRLAAGTYVCAEISDNGTGIEAEALPRIFEPFFTTKKAPHRGLGLALVYGMISNHGGGVAVSSQPGKGTSVRVYLPSEKSRVQDAGGSEKELRGAGTILVVDDENLLLTMAETILTDFGYQVLTASSGQKALQVLAQPATKVDLIVTDLVMPGMGGREMIEKIRAQGLAMPVLCTSGYVLPEDKQTGAGYLQKPFTSRELLSKVKSAMEHHG